MAYLSPAKSLRFGLPLGEESLIKTSQPRFLEQSKVLANALRGYDVAGLEKLMEISSKLSQLNVSRFLVIDEKMSVTDSDCRASVFCFNGEAYEGLCPESLSKKELECLNKQVRVISGYYGLLRPFDLMRAYRLEMGRRPEGIGFKNLYDFWGDKISHLLNDDAKSIGATSVISLASEEYDQAVKAHWHNQSKLQLHATRFESITKKGKKVVSFDAKRARGLFVRHMAQSEGKYENAEEMVKDFSLEEWRWITTKKTNALGECLFTFEKDFREEK